MHDMIGSAGMLRGWAAVWTMQIVWLFVSLSVAVGVLALIESLAAEYRRRRAPTVKPRVLVVMKDSPGSPAV